MIGRRSEEVLNRAVRYAFDRRHEYFTLEHVLLSLLEESDILEIIQECGGSYTVLKKQLEEYLDKEVPAHGKGAEEPEQREQAEEDSIVEHPVATLSIQRLIQRALFHVQSAGKDEILPEDLFVALFQAKDSYALHLLKKQGVERLDVVEYVSHGARKGTDLTRPEEQTTEEGAGARQGGRGRSRSEQDPLKNFTTNLNELARKGKIDPIVGRDLELDRMIQTLCRRRKNNPLLVGEAGVGKTALAEGLALRIVGEEVPSLLEQAVVYSLDLGSLLAGAKFRGDFEQRLKRVLDAIQREQDKGKKPILFIDEIHTIIGAGAVTGGAMDAANMLKPVLARGEIQTIGSTTYAEYRTVFEKDHALARRFQKIDIKEPTQEEAVRILEGLKSRFEEHHGVEYTVEALKAAVELSVKHLRDRFLPDKAIDVIDEVGAKARIARSQKMADEEAEAKASEESADSADVASKEETAAAVATDENGELQPRAVDPSKKWSDAIETTGKVVPPTVIDKDAVEAVIAQIARIPARSVSSSQKEKLQNLERDLKLMIYGQDHAIEALTTAIRLARSGLRTGEKPVGSFLFVGPTGVGKTELTKQLSHSLGVPFLRFDMSEYMEKHTVSRLIGAPPGYVGFEQSGLLTEALLKNPHSVILLDEIEKAHPDVWNILLQVMDHGTLTDSNGRQADFRNAIIVMTSNVGSREHTRGALGLGPETSKSVAAEKEVERAFTPEFRNRLDAIIQFNPLDPVTIAQVVGKQLVELENQLLAKNVEITFAAEVREWLAKKGYDRAMGARPMARLIQDKVKKPLSEQILFGDLEHGGRVEVSMGKEDEELEFKFDPNPAPPEKDEGSEPESQTVGSRSPDGE
jgi:ATP-dependent Clp protease ATP-binding subunit ClpA